MLGEETLGGHLSYPEDVTDELTKDVTTIFSTKSAFAALKNDGSVVTWSELRRTKHMTTRGPTCQRTNQADRNRHV